MPYSNHLVARVYTRQHVSLEPRPRPQPASGHSPRDWTFSFSAALTLMIMATEALTRSPATSRERLRWASCIAQGCPHLALASRALQSHRWSSSLIHSPLAAKAPRQPTPPAPLQGHGSHAGFSRDSPAWFRSMRCTSQHIPPTSAGRKIPCGAGAI